MKVAYICHPHLGGAFTFFRQARQALSAYGIELRCVSTESAEELAGTAFEGMEGIDILSMPQAVGQRARNLMDHIAETAFDATISLPGCGALGAALPRYVPMSVANLVRVPMMSRGAYAPTRAVVPWVSRIVAVSNRVASDLVRDYGMDASMIDVVYNGVDPSVYPIRPSGADVVDPFRILYAGRLSDIDKGVMLLPQIISRVQKQGVSVELNVVGQGPDRAALERACYSAGVGDHVHFLGPVSMETVRDHLRQADGYLLPSRLEGCPNGLMEAMAAGCLCVASDIVDSISRIVDDGVSGLLFRPGDAAEAADHIVSLSRNPAAWSGMRKAARKKIEDRFTLEHMANGYVRALDPARNARARRNTLNLGDFEVLPESAPTWRRFIPMPVKVWIRTRMERFGKSV